MSRDLSIEFVPRPKPRRALSRILTELAGVDATGDLWRVRLDPDAAAEFVHVWDVCKSYRDTTIRIDGRIQTRERARRILDWVRCLANHSMQSYGWDCSISPGLPGWGCRWLSAVTRYGGMGRLNGPAWWTVGRFDGVTFHVDRDAIRAALDADAAQICLGLCPHYAPERIAAAVEALPESITPETDPDWQYVFSSDPAAGSSVVGVRPLPLGGLMDRLAMDP